MTLYGVIFYFVSTVSALQLHLEQHFRIKSNFKWHCFNTENGLSNIDEFKAEITTSYNNTREKNQKELLDQVLDKDVQHLSVLLW